MSGSASNLNVVADIFQTAALTFTPPPQLTVSQWADTYRQLSSVSSAEPGQWRTSRAPWLQGIMDAFNDPEIEGVIVQSSAQIGKTECLNNVVGYFIHQDPSPVMVVQPTREDAEEWSKDRFMRGMIDCSPCFDGLITDAKVKGANNTIAHKEFPGGQLTVAWSNSKSRLAMRPIRVVLLDEVDKYPTDPGPQGDPCKRAINRTRTFWNRKWGKVSTPTLRQTSEITRAYEQDSDQRLFHVPCPHCGDKFALDFFKHIRWDKDDSQHHPKYGKHQPWTAYCVCPHCGAVIEESEKTDMVSAGIWIAQRPGGNVAGFKINELYSSLGASTWAAIAARFLEAKNDISALQNFYNETLGEPWELQGETVETGTLFARRESYPENCDCPMGVAVLTASVDTQKDRLEVLIKGWGPGEESWDILFRQLRGDPSKPEVWRELDQLLDARYKHELGIALPVLCTFIDSGGHHTQQVYRYCRARWGRHIYACKGHANTPGQPLPIVGRPNETNKLYTVGVDTAKQFIYRRLKVEKPGPGYYHFPLRPEWDEEYFLQLTAEKEVVRHKDFRPRLEWVALRERNEALDLNVYALAALEARHVDLVRAHASLGARAEIVRAQERDQRQTQTQTLAEMGAETPLDENGRPVVTSQTKSPETEAQTQPQPSQPSAAATATPTRSAPIPPRPRRFVNSFANRYWRK